MGYHGYGFSNGVQAIIMRAQISCDARDQGLNCRISLAERFTLRLQLGSLPAR
jgi:hypothetical protein